MGCGQRGTLGGHGRRDVVASDVSITNVVFHDPTPSRCERVGMVKNTLNWYVMQIIFGVKALCLASRRVVYSFFFRPFDIFFPVPPFALIFLSCAWTCILTSVIYGHKILRPPGISKFEVPMCYPDLDLPHLKGFGNENPGLCSTWLYT